MQSTEIDAPPSHASIGPRSSRARKDSRCAAYGPTRARSAAAPIAGGVIDRRMALQPAGAAAQGLSAPQTPGMANAPGAGAQLTVNQAALALRSMLGVVAPAGRTPLGTLGEMQSAKCSRCSGKVTASTWVRRCAAWGCRSTGRLGYDAHQRGSACFGFQLKHSLGQLGHRAQPHSTAQSSCPLPGIQVFLRPSHRPLVSKQGASARDPQLT